MVWCLVDAETVLDFVKNLLDADPSSPTVALQSGQRGPPVRRRMAALSVENHPQVTFKIKKYSPYGSKHCLRRYLSLQIIVNYTPNTS